MVFAHSLLLELLKMLFYNLMFGQKRWKAIPLSEITLKDSVRGDHYASINIKACFSIICNEIQMVQMINQSRCRTRGQRDKLLR